MKVTALFCGKPQGNNVLRSDYGTLCLLVSLICSLNRLLLQTDCHKTTCIQVAQIILLIILNGNICS